MPRDKTMSALDILEKCQKEHRVLIIDKTVLTLEENPDYRVVRWCEVCGSIRVDLNKISQMIEPKLVLPYNGGIKSPALYEELMKEYDKKPIEYFTEKTKCIHRLTGDDIPPGFDPDDVALDCKDDPECPYKKIPVTDI